MQGNNGNTEIQLPLPIPAAVGECTRCHHQAELFFDVHIRLENETLSGVWCRPCFKVVLDNNTALKLVTKGLLSQISNRMAEILNNV